MGLLIRLVELLIILVPLAGVLYGGWRAVSAARARQGDAHPQLAESTERPGTQPAVSWQAISRAVKAHDHTDTRWLEYELDVSKLLDFPLMTDMRDPLTERFHRTKLRADLLRPARAEDLVDDGAAREYVDAVTDYVTAFDAAEREAIRRRRSDFSQQDQQRLARAQTMLRVATDPAATPQERERGYHGARRELDGLIVLPERVRAAVERGIAGELDG